MWHEYIIPADYEEQKRVIRELRMWIERLDREGLVTGFAFNHYYNNPSVPNELRIRFEYPNEENRARVEKEIEENVMKLMGDYTLRQRMWNNGTTPEHVLRAYEYGSRCDPFLESGCKRTIRRSLDIEFSSFSSNK